MIDHHEVFRISIGRERIDHFEYPSRDCAVLRSVDEPLQELGVLRLPHDLDDRVLGWPAVREGLSKVSQSNQ